MANRACGPLFWRLHRGGSSPVGPCFVMVIFIATEGCSLLQVLGFKKPEKTRKKPGKKQKKKNGKTREGSKCVNDNIRGLKRSQNTFLDTLSAISMSVCFQKRSTTSIPKSTLRERVSQRCHARRNHRGRGFKPRRLTIFNLRLH